MGFFDKLFGGKNEFNFGGVLYPLTADKNIFIQTISSTKYGALTIKLSDYSSTLKFIAENIVQKFGHNSAMFNAITKEKIICSKCNADLTFKVGMASLGLSTFNIVSQRTFNKCDHCGNNEAYYIFDCMPSGDITQNDVDLIRRYQQTLAKDWWDKNPNETQIACYGLDCDGYGKVKRGMGYFVETNIECERCYNKRFSGALETLKKDPNYYGTGLVRRARTMFSGQTDIKK